jgi:hypothetical protein
VRCCVIDAEVDNRRVEFRVGKIIVGGAGSGEYYIPRGGKDAKHGVNRERGRWGPNSGHGPYTAAGRPFTDALRLRENELPSSLELTTST